MLNTNELFADIPLEKIIPQIIVAEKERLTVFLSGSVVEGYANRSSDIDVYVFLSSPLKKTTTKKTSSCSIDVKFANNMRIDIEYWDNTMIQKIFNKLDSIDLTDDNQNNLDYLSGDEVEFLNNLRIAIPIENNEMLAKQQQKINVEKFSRYLAFNQLLYTEDAFDDTVSIWSL